MINISTGYTRKDNRERGITLVALIITIIILVILAAVTIDQVFDLKIVETAINGTQNYTNAQIQEKEDLDDISKTIADAVRKTEIVEIKYNIGKEIKDLEKENNRNITDEELKEILEKYGTLSEEGEKIEDKTLTTNKGGYEIKVSDILKGPVEEAPDKPTEPNKPIVADKSGANKPNLSKLAQKTYVTWDYDQAKSEYVINDKQTAQPNNWYDYDNGKWANIKTAKNGLEAYWVWIPRYEYIVPTSEVATKIEVRFIGTDKKEGASGYTKQSDGTIKSNDGYTIHPAFTNTGNGGLGELDGIWVAKFEASSNTGTPDTNYGGGNDTKLKVQVKPGVQSWRNIACNNIFTVCRRMTGVGEVLEGSSVDSHLMKNMEWGAVAILSQSKYGVYNPESLNGEKGDKEYQIWNNSNGYKNYKYTYTGYAGDSKNALTAMDFLKAPTNVYAYNTKNGPKASTTGTIYGVYDMAGGTWEYVAGCINGQEEAKFGVTKGDSKYIDLYTDNSAKTGDVTKETEGWNDDQNAYIYSYSPVILRGRLLHWRYYDRYLCIFMRQWQFKRCNRFPSCISSIECILLSNKSKIYN